MVSFLLSSMVFVKEAGESDALKLDSFNVSWPPAAGTRS